MVIGETDLFACEALQCRLTRRACAERNVRAEALKKAPDGNWNPDQWAKFASPCRGCTRGRENVQAFQMRVPNKPKAPRPPAPSRRAVKRRRTPTPTTLVHRAVCRRCESVLPTGDAEALLDRLCRLCLPIDEISRLRPAVLGKFEKTPAPSIPDCLDQLSLPGL